MIKPELLSPAGSLDKLKTSVLYGADAVYLAGQKFGLRAAAENFTIDELEEGVQYAHSRGVKVYTVLNGFLHDADLKDLPKFIDHLSRLKVDGVIASDLGVITTVLRNSDLKIHLSTQATCLNDESALAWIELGVSRIILGREVSIQDAKRIKEITGIEVELFIHGSMCMAYSGNCTISNFTQGRDSNRGGCAQSCRFSYSLEWPRHLEYEKKSEQDTFFMSAKDLMGLELLPLIFKAGIDSLKIEGRMRSPLYAGMVSKIYREAIDAYSYSPEIFNKSLGQWQDQLNLIPHREYSTGNLKTPAGAPSVYKKSPENRAVYEFIGIVRKVVLSQYLLIEVRNPFTRDDCIELVLPKGDAIAFKPLEMLKSCIGELIPKARQDTIVRIPFFKEAREGCFLRRIT